MLEPLLEGCHLHLFYWVVYDQDILSHETRPSLHGRIDVAAVYANFSHSDVSLFPTTFKGLSFEIVRE